MLDKFLLIIWNVAFLILSMFIAAYDYFAVAMTLGI